MSTRPKWKRNISTLNCFPGPRGKSAGRHVGLAVTLSFDVPRPLRGIQDHSNKAKKGTFNYISIKKGEKIHTPVPLFITKKPRLTLLFHF